MSDEPHATLWFDATLVLHGDDAAVARHYGMIAAVLKALGCTDINAREQERSEGCWRCAQCRQSRPGGPSDG